MVTLGRPDRRGCDHGLTALAYPEIAVLTKPVARDRGVLLTPRIL